MVTGTFYMLNTSFLGVNIEVPINTTILSISLNKPFITLGKMSTVKLPLVSICILSFCQL